MKNTPLVLLRYTLFFAVALYFSLVYLDPDFGWRLRLGNHLLQNGIPATDLYSYTMPSFRFVDHEWLTHVAMAALYARAGYTGLAISATLIFITTLVLITRAFDKNWAAAHIFLVGIVLLHHFGVKPQIISWLFGALFFLMTTSARWETRWRYIAPLFFLVWANLHGGFVFGVLIYTIKFMSDIITSKKKDVAAIAWYVAAIAATFVNPYGFRLWEEIIRTGTDTRLRIQIMEWTPQFLYMSLSSLFIVAWYMTIFARYFKHTPLYQKSIIILLLVFGFSSSRNFPLWLVVATPIIAPRLQRFIKDAQKNKITKERIRKFSVGFTFFVTGMVIFELVFLFQEMRSYAETNKYPLKAVEYLRGNPTPGNMIAAYEWGGYLIWKYPEKKVFIDGRMPSWRQDPKAHPDESPDALGDFTSFLTQQKPMSTLLTKYQIDTVLLPKQYFNKKIGKSNTKTIEKFEKTLQKNNLELIYQDDLAVIYR